MDYEINKEAQYNQASYQQLRINDLLQLIDRASINPLAQDQSIGVYNYQLIFNNLNSLFITTHAKYTEEELKEVQEMKKELQNFINTNPIFQQRLDPRDSSRRTIVFQTAKWNTLWDMILNYRMKIEKLMDVHGFGNPTKEDPATEGEK